MTDEGGGRPANQPPRDSSPSGNRRGPRRRLAGYIGIAAGYLLAGVPPGPPETLWQWLVLASGAVVAAVSAAYVAQHIKPPEIGTYIPSILHWLAGRKAAIGVVAVFSAALAFGVPPAVDFGRGVAIGINGCEAATQLRMVASQETVVTARELAGAYERWTAGENHGCPSVDVYVYAAGSDDIRERMRDADGWSDQTDALREVGPRPDVWLAATSHELDGLGAVAAATPIAISPVVVATPEPVTYLLPRERTSWAELFRRIADQGVALVRADPGGTELGLLATALLYGIERADPAARAEIERYLAASLDEGGFPPTDTAGLLCRHQMLRSQAAVVASEQLVALFNMGELPCPAGAGERGRLVALYPSDTRGLDHQFVRLSWSESPQDDAAAAFGEWLSTDPGRDAIVRTGLRPPAPFTVESPLTANGLDPSAEVRTELVPMAAWSAATEAYDLAQRRGRALIAVDTSGSMATAGPDGVRFAVASAAVASVLGGIGPRDEFGLWFFPGTPGTGHVEAVPLGPPDEARLTMARLALDGVRPVGNTPLFRTMIDAAATVRSPDPTQVEAVVVLTDGEDTSSGVGAEVVNVALAGGGVRLVVVTIGDLRCADSGLAALATATAGECVDADLPDLDTALASATAGLWGGR